MKVQLKNNVFEAELVIGGIEVHHFDTRQGKVHVAAGEYLITTDFGEKFAVTEAQFNDLFVEIKPKPKKVAKK